MVFAHRPLFDLDKPWDWFTADGARAIEILQKRGGDNKQMFVITDGQPTAHVEGNYVHLLYPPDPKSTLATLKEVLM